MGLNSAPMIVENIHPDTESGQAQGINVCAAPD